MPPPQISLMSAIQGAQNGGDYSALFQGKKLKFKLAKVLTDTLKESNDILNDDATRAASGIVKTVVGGKILELAKGIKESKSAQWLKDGFMELVEVFDALKSALEFILRPLLDGTTVGAILELLFSTVPEVLSKFIGNIVSALVPFVGQVVATGEMLLDIGNYVYTKYKSTVSKKAAFKLDAKSDFTKQSRIICEKMIDDEVKTLRNEALLASANCAVSLSGLAFTGNIVSSIAGTANAITKLCLQIVSFVRESMTLKAGNAELEKLSRNPNDLSPSRLFAAAPILGAYYIGCASQSSIISFTEVNKHPLGSSAWKQQYEQVAAALSPFRMKALSLVGDSLLELA